jgi:hypothetical protein
LLDTIRAETAPLVTRAPAGRRSTGAATLRLTDTGHAWIKLPGLGYHRLRSKQDARGRDAQNHSH